MSAESYPLSHGSLVGLTGNDHHPQYAMPGQGPASTRPTGPWRFGRLYYASDTSQLSFDQGAGWLDLASKAYVDTAVAGFTSTKTVRVPHTFQVAGPVAVASGDTYYIPPFYVPKPTGQSVSLAKAIFRINSGASATVKLQRAALGGAAADITGFTGISVQTTDSWIGGPSTALADGDKIALVVTAISGSPMNLTFTIYLDYTV